MSIVGVGKLLKCPPILIAYLSIIEEETISKEWDLTKHVDVVKK